MIEVEIDYDFQHVAKHCVRYLGPLKFYLHNRIGGEGWDVRPNPQKNYRVSTIARFNDPRTATFIMLKIK